MLAIARVVMADPRILLLDEPSLGLAPAMIDELFAVIAELRPSRRQALAALNNDKFIVHKLFEEVAPRYANRPGGYTRILKLGPRRSDSTEMVYLELV